MRKRGGRHSSSDVLHRHQKVGNRLKSPLNTIPQLQNVSYIDEILPEIIHIAMILDAHGYADGIKLCISLFSKISPKLEKPDLPLVSALSKVSEDGWTEIADELDRDGDLARLKLANTPLSILIPQWPLRFIGSFQMDEPIAVSHLETCVGRHLDRHKTPACVVLATIMYWQGISGKLHFAQGLHVPDLNAIIDAPDSEEAKMASSEVRAFMMACMGFYKEEHGSQWAEDFWSEAMRLSPCRAEGVEDDDS